MATLLIVVSTKGLILLMSTTAGQAEVVPSLEAR